MSDAADDQAGDLADEERLSLDTGRVEAFSDGVMAVIITLMAFELKAPAGASFHDLRQRLPELLVYILSFVYIGIYWNNHHHLMRRTPRISGAVMWANLHLLFWLSLIPVLTEWVGVDYRHALPAATYGFVALAAAIAYWILVHAILTANRGSSIVAAVGSDRKGSVSIVVYVAAALLAFVNPWIAYALYAAVAAMWFIPDRRMER